MNECKKEKRGGICFYNCDNIEFMKTKTDNYYDLAIVDPPYGISEGKKSRGMGTCAMAGDYKIKDWDNEIPSPEYFEQLFRVSKNQIIWGGNYMVEFLKPSMGWIFWDKDSSGDFSDGELAYTSFNKALRKIKIVWMGMRQYNMKNKEKRIHPTQKPIMLYRWTLQEYAEKGFKILDTHGGSFTHAIAADMEGFKLDIMDNEIEYFTSGLNAFDEYKRQLKLF